MNTARHRARRIGRDLQPLLARMRVRHGVVALLPLVLVSSTLTYSEITLPGVDRPVTMNRAAWGDLVDRGSRGDRGEPDGAAGPLAMSEPRSASTSVRVRTPRGADHADPNAADSTEGRHDGAVGSDDVADPSAPTSSGSPSEPAPDSPSSDPPSSEPPAPDPNSDEPNEPAPSDEPSPDDPSEPSPSEEPSPPDEPEPSPDDPAPKPDDPEPKRENPEPSDSPSYPPPEPKEEDTPEICLVLPRLPICIDLAS